MHCWSRVVGKLLVVTSNKINQIRFNIEQKIPLIFNSNNSCAFLIHLIRNSDEPTKEFKIYNNNDSAA